jgi:sec-independent protein translocase protein TatA
MELMVIAVLGVLLFGRKLPDVGRYLGKSITEFRKGMKGLEDDLDSGVANNGRPATNNAVTPEPVRVPQKMAVTAPKFQDAPSPSQPQV